MTNSGRQMCLALTLPALNLLKALERRFVVDFGLRGAPKVPAGCSSSPCNRRIHVGLMLLSSTTAISFRRPSGLEDRSKGTGPQFTTYVVLHSVDEELGAGTQKITF